MGRLGRGGPARWMEALSDAERLNASRSATQSVTTAQGDRSPNPPTRLLAAGPGDPLKALDSGAPAARTSRLVPRRRSRRLPVEPGDRRLDSDRLAPARLRHVVSPCRGLCRASPPPQCRFASLIRSLPGSCGYMGPFQGFGSQSALRFSHQGRLFTVRASFPQERPSPGSDPGSGVYSRGSRIKRVPPDPNSLKKQLRPTLGITWLGLARAKASVAAVRRRTTPSRASARAVRADPQKPTRGSRSPWKSPATRRRTTARGHKSRRRPATQLVGAGARLAADCAGWADVRGIWPAAAAPLIQT